MSGETLNSGKQDSLNGFGLSLDQIRHLKLSPKFPFQLTGCITNMCLHYVTGCHAEL